MRILPCIGLLLLFACDSSSYKGYKQSNETLHYKRIYLGEGVAYQPDSCFLDYTVRVKPYFTEEPGLEKSIKFAQFSDELLEDSVLIGLQKGDRLRFISSRQELYYKDLAKMETNDTAKQIFELHVDEVYNLYRQSEDHNVKEYKELSSFLDSYSEYSFQYIDGIWIRFISNPNRREIMVSGDLVLDYKGYSLEGEAWDIPDYPMFFNMEDSYQVVKGLELALQHLHFGDSADVVLPSYMAFGEKGSKNGKIPAYRSLHYRVKVYDPQEYYSSHSAELSSGTTP